MLYGSAFTCHEWFMSCATRAVIDPYPWDPSKELVNGGLGFRLLIARG